MPTTTTRSPYLLTAFIVLTLGSVIIAPSVWARLSPEEPKVETPKVEKAKEDVPAEKSDETVAAAAAGKSESSESPSVKTASSEDATMQTGYLLTLRETITYSDGTPEFKRADITRYQQADGGYVQVTTRYAADEKATTRTETLVGDPKRGLFRVNQEKGTIEFVAPMAEPPTDNKAVEDALRRDGSLARDEEIAGYRTVVLRRSSSGRALPADMPETDLAEFTEYTESYRAPQLGGALIKQVTHSKRGTLTLEPVEVKALDARSAHPQFQMWLSMTVTAERYERRIAELERKGELDLAAQMREQLARARDIRASQK